MNPCFLLLLALMLAQPYLSVRSWRRFVARPDDPGARLALYRRSLTRAWASVALLALGMWWQGGSLRDLGLHAPTRYPSAPTLFGYALILAVGLALPVSLPWLRRRVASALGTLGQLLPRTPRERAWFVLVALTAGLCEELLYRGFLLGLAHRYWPDLPWHGYLVIGALPFGLAHVYQGRRNAAVATIAGALFTFLVLLFDSLWVPILVHALIDLRALFFPVPAKPAARTG